MSFIHQNFIETFTQLYEISFEKDYPSNKLITFNGVCLNEKLA